MGAPPGVPSALAEGLLLQEAKGGAAGMGAGKELKHVQLDRTNRPPKGLQPAQHMRQTGPDLGAGVRAGVRSSLSNESPELTQHLVRNALP